MSVSAYKAKGLDGGIFIIVLFQFLSPLEGRDHFTVGFKLGEHPATVHPSL